MKKTLILLGIGLLIIFAVGTAGYLSLLFRPDLQILGYFSFRNKCVELVDEKLNLATLKKLDRQAYIVNGSRETSEKYFRENIEEHRGKQSGQIFIRKSFFPDVHYRCTVVIDPNHMITKANYSFWTE
jgi:hypothetical protein